MGRARKSNRKGTSTTKKNRCLRLNGQPKITHATKAEAISTAKTLFGRTLKPYFCVKCGGYHLTSQGASNKYHQSKSKEEWAQSQQTLSQDFQNDRPKLDGRFDDLTLADKLNKWANGNAD